MLLLLDVITNQIQQNLTYRNDNRSHIIKLPTLGKLYFIFVKFKFANNLNWVHLSHLPVLRDDKENRRENHKQIN